jgi:hypothetical protein
MGFRWNGNALNWLLRIVIVAALILAALGSGNPATVDPLPDWINTGSNLLCLLIAAAVLIPRLEIWAALATMAMMVASMVTNYAVDGPTYFWRVLPFNLVTLMAAFLLLLRSRRVQV